MRNQTRYEWCVEFTDDGGDVVDHYHADKLSEIPDDVMNEGDLVLIRNVGNEYDGVNDRSWAYVVDGKLHPMFMSGDVAGETVPQRFHAELARRLG